MKIPTILYGTYKEVKARCRKTITTLKRGDSWEEIFASQEYLDSKDYSSSLIMDGPCPNNGSRPFFHCYVLHREFALSPLCTRHLPDHIYYPSISSPWSLAVIAKLGGLGDPLFETIDGNRRASKSRTLAFWEAIYQSWDELQNVGKRYCCARDRTVWYLTKIVGRFESAFEAQGLSLVEFVEARYDYIDDFTISKDKIGEIIEIAKLGLDSLCAKIY